MKELAKPSNNVYATKKYLKEKLQLKYKQNIFLQKWMGSQVLSALEILQTL